MRKLVLSLLVAAPLMVACNTVAGAGKDVKAAGNAIEKTADKAKGDKSNWTHPALGTPRPAPRWLAG